MSCSTFGAMSVGTPHCFYVHIKENFPQEHETCHLAYSQNTLRTHTHKSTHSLFMYPEKRALIQCEKLENDVNENANILFTSQNTERQKNKLQYQQQQNTINPPRQNTQHTQCLMKCHLRNRNRKKNVKNNTDTHSPRLVLSCRSLVDCQFTV